MELLLLAMGALLLSGGGAPDNRPWWIRGTAGWVPSPVPGKGVQMTQEEALQRNLEYTATVLGSGAGTALAGAGVGATVGTAVEPGIGTGVGAAVGGVVGALAGTVIPGIAEMSADWSENEESNPWSLLP